MQTANRRYDIDWIRVIAIGLLLLYHTAITFQPWATMIGFIANERSWESLWIPMSMLNIWRIPLLFFVSGMGVYFALGNRTWQQLLLDRSKRILVPFLFGSIAIVPIHIYLWQRYYAMKTTYVPSPGHLWFLGNLMVYILILLPLCYYLKKQQRLQCTSLMLLLWRSPLGLLLVFALSLAEALVLNPKPFELYAMTLHGFFLGLFAFFFGFCFAWSGRPFWEMLLRWKGLLLLSALGLFLYRINTSGATPNYLLSIESNCWILSIFGFAYRYLNNPSRILNYLSKAIYPVYMLHMIFLYLANWLIFPLQIPVPLQFVLVLLMTIAGPLACYEFIIKRLTWLRFLYGLST